MQDHVVRLESKPPNIEGKGEVSIRDLVKSSLRMRPDRVVIGECRSGEALDMIQAMNTGHDGSLTTTHANTPRDALARIATLVLMAGVELPEKAIREQIASAVNLIVQTSRLQDGSRRIVQISEIQGMEGTMITLQDLFIFEQTGLNGDGQVTGFLRGTGIIPKCLERMRAHGENLPVEVFQSSVEVP
jgi:pilus assembly protein CpaF